MDIFPDFKACGEAVTPQRRGGTNSHRTYEIAA
jgi:hypothetical protein